MVIESFTGENYFLSNFYEFPVEVFGLKFQNSEAAFQSQKSLNKSIQQKFCNLPPFDAKHLAHSLPLRIDWESVKVDVMRDVLQAKFSDPELKRRLMNTHPHRLVEGNTWGDKYWGVCDGEGKNYLGRLLMELRDKLMRQQKVTYASLDQYLGTISSENLVVVSPASYYKLSSYCQQQLKIRCDMAFTTAIQAVGIKTFAKVYQSLDTVYAIGGGTAIDFAKYLAAHSGVRCVVIPSMLSTNAFATNKVAILEDGHKYTENGVLPDEVVLDEQYLALSPKGNLYGLVDVYSIFTALMDWELAERDTPLVINQSIYNKAKELLIKSIILGEDIIKQPDNYEWIYKIFGVIQEAGYLTNEYGSGRPESGSEHIFASALESKLSIPHALAVTLGIHIMLYYYQATQNISTNWIKAFGYIPFQKLGIIDDINALGLSWDLIQSVIKNLVPRVDKYTIVDTFKSENPPIALRQHLKQFGIVLE